MDIALVERKLNTALVSINAVTDLKSLEAVKVEYLGRNSFITQAIKELASLQSDEKKAFGKKINEIKESIETAYETKKASLEDNVASYLTPFYKSLPGIKPDIGHLHVITQATREIVDIFKPLGFTRVRYPEIEWEFYAFEALNMPMDHPARDEWETFFVSLPESRTYGKMVITPHTSSGQVREMQKGILPIRMLNISRCGRRQIDLKHLQTFFQFEGLVVDKGINIQHLKGVLTYFVKNFFDSQREIRLRPYDFRFTEPSFEVDISCGLCKGAGCRLCKGGWMELGGAGMVHPSVLKAGNIDPSTYSGFAFGWGVERTYMMKSGTQIDDIRHLFENDFKFLEQF